MRTPAFTSVTLAPFGLAFFGVLTVNGTFWNEWMGSGRLRS